jgi:hypothetical protein
MAISKLVLDEFSGGILESTSPSDFTQRQWTQLKGFVLESENELRSQWECQQVSNRSDVKYLRGFNTGTTKFLVALRNDGTLIYMPAPSRTAATATVNGASWTTLTVGTDPGGNTVNLNSSLKLRFLTELQFVQNSKYTTGLLIHTGDTSSTSPAIVLYESSTNVLSAKVYTDFYPTSTMVNPTTGFVDNDPDLNTFELGTGSVIPRANVGCMWGNFLVLGDVEWGTRYPLTAATAVATGWDADNSITFTNTNTFTVDINGAGAVTCTVDATPRTGAACAAYLEGLIKAALQGSNATNQGYVSKVSVSALTVGSGVSISLAVEGLATGQTVVLANVSGTPLDLLGLAGTFTAVANAKPYRNGLWISSTDYAGIPDPTRFLPVASMNLVGTPDSVIRGLQVTDRGLLVFTTSTTTGDGVLLLRGTPPVGDGTVTYVQEVLRGGMGVPANTANQHSVCHGLWPEAGAVAFVESKGALWHTNGTDVGRLDLYGPTAPAVGQGTDSVAAIGPFLFVSRGSGSSSRLLCMRKFETDGAWTELVTPQPSTQALCLTALEDCLYFTQFGRVYRYAFAAGTRGLVAGAAATLTVSTAPLYLQDLSPDKKHWFRVGVRVAENTAGAILKTVTSLPQSPLVSGTGFTTTLDAGVESRTEMLVRGHGPSVEAAVQVTLTGDVTVESVTVWVSGKEPSR